jgi:hypothetical protein
LHSLNQCIVAQKLAKSKQLSQPTHIRPSMNTSIGEQGIKGGRERAPTCCMSVIEQLHTESVID